MTRLFSSTLLALAICLTVTSMGLVPPTTHVLPRDRPQITAKPISRPDLFHRDVGSWVEVCPTSGAVTGCDYIAIHNVIAEPNGGHYVPACDSNNDCQYIGYIEPTASIVGSTSYQLHTSEGLSYIVPVAVGLLLGDPVPPPGPAPGPDTPDAPEDSALPSPTTKSSIPPPASSKTPTAKSSTALAASSTLSSTKSSTPLPASSWRTTAKSPTTKAVSTTTAITSSQSLASTISCSDTATTTVSVSLNDDWFVSEIEEWGTTIDWLVGWVGGVTAVPPATTATPSAISAPSCFINSAPSLFDGSPAATPATWCACNRNYTYPTLTAQPSSKACAYTSLPSTELSVSFLGTELHTAAPTSCRTVTTVLPAPTPPGSSTTAVSCTCNNNLGYLYTSSSCWTGGQTATITPVPTKASSSPTPAWSTCYSSADLSVRVFGDFVSATAKASASAYCTGIANVKPAQPPHQGWPGGCAVPNPGGLPAMPDSEINFNVNKDTGGFCAGVSYSTAAFNLDDCLAAYNAILSDCE